MAGDIWLGDVARAFAALRPVTDQQRRSIARLLGVAVPEPENEQLPMQSEERGEVFQVVDLEGVAARGDDVAVEAATPPDLPLLTPIGQDPVAATGWGAQSLPPVTREHLTAVPMHEPLFAPRTAAAILQAVIARSTEEGPLDVPAVVDVLARRQPVQSLPRERTSTLRFGVQVLVDLGVAMQPFARDQAHLVAQVGGIIGAERTSVRYFADSPMRGAGPGPRRTWRRYKPPDPGTRVLVLSDLGMGGPALHLRRSQPDEWRSLVGDLRARGSDIVALVPLPPDRWPPSLSALLPLISWDRNATVSRVLAALGHGGEA